MPKVFDAPVLMRFAFTRKAAHGTAQWLMPKLRADRDIKLVADHHGRDVSEVAVFDQPSLLSRWIKEKAACPYLP